MTCWKSIAKHKHIDGVCLCMFKQYGQEQQQGTGNRREGEGEGEDDWELVQAHITLGSNNIIDKTNNNNNNRFS